jgi:hypothetical protein
MKKFRDVLSRWEAGELSMMEAGELLGMSERQFRRYRGRYEEDGAEGLLDRRLGKPSPKRVPAAERPPLPIRSCQPNPKRTYDVLPKPDNLISYRQG